MDSNESRWMMAIHFAGGLIMLLYIMFEKSSAGNIISAAILGGASILLGLYWKTQI
jgi:hypothetical protein